MEIKFGYCMTLSKTQKKIANTQLIYLRVNGN